MAMVSRSKGDFCSSCWVVSIKFFPCFTFMHCSFLNHRHEKPTDPDDPLADQNIKDRYYGINDPVADKLLKRASTMPRLDPPEDKTITTLYVGGLGDTITETDLRFVNIILWVIFAFTSPRIFFFFFFLAKTWENMIILYMVHFSLVALELVSVMLTGIFIKLSFMMPHNVPQQCLFHACVGY